MGESLAIHASGGRSVLAVASLDATSFAFSAGTPVAGGSWTVLLFEPSPPRGAPATLAVDPDRGASLGEGVLACRVHASWLRAVADGASGLSPGRFYLPPHLRGLALAALETAREDPARQAVRTARAVELVCEAVALASAGDLLAAPAGCAGEVAQTGRLLRARQIITERFAERLTLSRIARESGVNRARLTRGFRDLFQCTVGEAIVEARLDFASRELRTTNDPVAIIGYRSGYQNNASFARAFARRFGRSPSAWRAAAASGPANA